MPNESIQTNQHNFFNQKIISMVISHVNGQMAHSTKLHYLLLLGIGSTEVLELSKTKSGAGSTSKQGRIKNVTN